jgi:murein DD-endopeptidase MepM/ murein hydrolase activator NlpD
MQKNDKYYTFLLSHKYKNKIRIRRFQVSRSSVTLSSLALFLTLGFSALIIGVGSTLRNTAFAETLSAAALQTQLRSAVPAQRSETVIYQRPAESSDIAVNSGGPDENVADGEDAEIDNEVLAIKNTSDPAFLPTMWAHLGKINNEFGFRRNPFGGRAYEFHPGMDIDGERGEVVLASANGTVIKAGVTGGYGNMIEIDHGNGLTSRYGHLSKIDAEVGQSIARGTPIGQIGSTGRSTGPHLHFELRLNDKPINPRHFLPQEPAELPEAK